MVGRILIASACTLATTRKAGVKIWARWFIPKNRPFIVLPSILMYANGHAVISINYKSRPKQHAILKD